MGITPSQIPDRHPMVGPLSGGCWPSWKAGEGQNPSDIDIETITHVNYCFAAVDGEKGRVYFEDKKINEEMEVDGARGCLRAWTQRRHQKPSLKIILTIGDGHAAAEFQKIAWSPLKVGCFIKSVQAIVAQYELDGVNIDWEVFKGIRQGRQFLKIMRSLRKALPPPFLVRTVLPADPGVLQNIPLGRLAPHIDHLDLMAYDFVGPGPNVTLTGHQAQLFRAGSSNTLTGAAAVEHLTKTQGFPTNKIVLGIPLYGRAFRKADGPNRPFDGPGTTNNGVYEFKDFPQPGTKEHHDAESVAAFATGGGEYVTYDDKKAVMRKAEFARQHNLAGLYYWQLAGDKKGNDSLVRAGYEVLQENIHVPQFDRV